MKYYDELKEAISAEDLDLTEEILDRVEQDDNSIEYVSALLGFIEENPDLDYGMPGPAVRYMERFFLKGYEQLLFESLTRKPTMHTLWMLNRILNSPKLEEKDRYLSLLENIASDDSIGEKVRVDAGRFLNYQTGNR